jgi:hypothetical protein
VSGADTDPVQTIAAPSGQTLAVLVRANWNPSVTTFITPDDWNLQLGAIVYGRGQAIPAHMHLPITREIHGTNEVVMVRQGGCDVDLYDDGRSFVRTLRLNQGDVILLLGGAHGFRMLEDTVLFEVKQGPYAGGKDKERFTP